MASKSSAPSMPNVENSIDQYRSLGAAASDSQDLKERGILLGHRRKMLAAIGELSREPAPAPEWRAQWPLRLKPPASVAI